MGTASAAEARRGARTTTNANNNSVAKRKVEWCLPLNPLGAIAWVIVDPVRITLLQRGEHNS